ncbi:MAG: glycosyltransferase [Gammaproteobacteria bacterium]|nr:glycosyltransferase [Gammaproteobacteria bacterium]
MTGESGLPQGGVSRASGEHGEARQPMRGTTESEEQGAPDWTVIVIARNEEATIAASLESVVRAFEGRSYELIFVDSASTDGTVAIAKQFPARVFGLPPNAPMRPSVGRHVGLKFARGKWILFLDGDSTLYGSWVDLAEAAFGADPMLAGVAGDSEQIVPLSNGQTDEYLYPFPESDYDHADFLGASAAYRREALEQAGGFNPFMRAAEEEELGARLRKSNYWLTRLRAPMTREFAKHASETASELFRRIGRRFFVGIGQIVRHAHAHDLPVREGLIIVRRYLQYFVLLVLGVLSCIVTIITGKWAFVGAWAALMIVVVALFVIRTRSVRKPLYYLLEWTLTSPIVVWGILQRPRTEAEFPELPVRELTGK